MIDKIKTDLEAYCKKHNHTTHAPPCEEFFEAMTYSRWQLQKRRISWKAFVADLGMNIALPRYAGKKVRPYRQKGLEKDKNTLQTRCQCGTIFESPVDHKGSRLNRRCDACKQRSINSEDYSGQMGEALYNTVPEDNDFPRDFAVEIKGRLY